MERQAYLDVLDSLSAEVDRIRLGAPESLSQRRVKLRKRKGLQRVPIEIHSSGALPNPDISEEVLKYVDSEVRTSITVGDSIVYQIMEREDGYRYLAKSPFVHMAAIAGFGVSLSERREVTDPNEVYEVVSLLRGARVRSFE